MDGGWICGDVAYEATFEGVDITVDSMPPVSYDASTREF